MTREEATNILKAKLECYKRQTEPYYNNCDECSLCYGEAASDCNICDECSLCYEQGTMGEQKRALEMAIMELEVAETKV